MTNAEKYLKDNVSVEELARKLVDHFELDMELTDSENSVLYYNCQNFFIEQTKPTLTEDERVILRNIKHTALDKIKRTNKGALYIEHFWIDYGEEIRFLYDDLFQFIKERRRI